MGSLLGLEILSGTCHSKLTHLNNKRLFIYLYKVLRPFYNKLVFSQRRKKPPFSKMIPFSGLSLSRMDDLYRNINWATASNIEDDCPNSKLG